MGTQNMARRQAGYTIVEVTLFLGISAMLFLITLVGTGNSVRVTRFSDSSRSITTYMQKQYDDLVNGVNTRQDTHACNDGNITTTGSATQTPGTSNCIFMGKAIEFDRDAGEFRSYNVVGTTPTTASAQNLLTWDAVVIHSYQPRLVRQTGADVFQIPWGAFVSDTKRDNGLAFDTVLFIYNPVTSEVETDLYKRPSNTYTNVADLINPANSANFANINQVGSICLASADGDTPPSRLYLGGDLYQSSIQLYYNVQPGDCNGS